MTTLTVYAQSVNGWSVSEGTANYAACRNLTDILQAFGSQATQLGIVGQEFITDWKGFHSWLSFDTSALGASANITAVALSLYGNTDQSATDFTIEARLTDWGAALTTADMLTGASLAAQTRLATLSSAAWSVSGYNALAEDGANFINNVNKTGITRLVVGSSRYTGNNAPAGKEYVQFDLAGYNSPTHDPKLVITYGYPPTVTSVTPTHGPKTGGDSVTIVGTLFTGATAVTFGGVAATSFVVVDASHITAVTPAMSNGNNAVAVTTPDGTGTLA